MEGLLIIIVVIGFIFLAIMKRGKNHQKDIEINTQLVAERLKLTKDIDELRKIKASLEIDNSVQLTALENDILDIYQLNNIQIPMEIIEEMHSLLLNDVDDAINFVEAQRQNWKQENSKKLYRKVTK